MFGFKRKTTEDLEHECEEATKQVAKSEREKLALHILDMLDEKEHWCIFGITNKSSCINLKTRLHINVEYSNYTVIFPDNVNLPSSATTNKFYSKIAKIKEYYEEEKAKFILVHLQNPFTVKIDFRESLKSGEELNDQTAEIRKWFLEMDFEDEYHYSESGFAWFRSEADAILFKTAWG